MIAFHTSLSNEFISFNDNTSVDLEVYGEDKMPKISNVSQTNKTISDELFKSANNGTLLYNKNIQNASIADDIIKRTSIIDNSEGLSIVPIIGIENGNMSSALLNSLNNYKYGFKKFSNGRHNIDVYNISEYFSDEVPDTKEADKKDSKKDDTEKKEKRGKTKAMGARSLVAQSLFNPYYGVKSTGMHSNLPLIDSVSRKSMFVDDDVSDCSIMKLLQLSAIQRKTTKGQVTMTNMFDLGFQFYRLSDFMFCKHLGEVSNNHLITLRRYPSPVGDNIYGRTRSHDKYDSWAGQGELGHLVTWFGTEDNKLSDIFKFNYKATWKKMDAKIEIKKSEADSQNTGFLGMIANFNPRYHKASSAGFTGTNNIISHLFSGHFGSLSKYGVNFGRGGQYENHEILDNYDQHKIYEPKNTIRYNHYYDGELEFEQNFTLNFSYKLNAYSSINGKSAMLDLLTNILRVTYTQGKFWGGQSKIIGAPTNDSAIMKMDAFIDNTFDKLEGFARDALNGGINWKEMIGSISNALSNMVSNGLKTVKGWLENPESAVQQAGNALLDFCDKYNVGDAIKGGLKNALGRPALYAFSSLVKGDNTGLWHVTVGNPRNPIMCIGNLIMDSAEITGIDAPLGLDDFPTEIKVSCSLKHAKPRDMVDIQRMFTKGEGSIYVGLQQKPATRYYNDEKVTNEGLTWENYDARKSLTQLFGTNNVDVIKRSWNELI